MFGHLCEHYLGHPRSLQHLLHLSGVLRSYTHVQVSCTCPVQCAAQAYDHCVHLVHGGG